MRKGWVLGIWLSDRFLLLKDHMLAANPRIPYCMGLRTGGRVFLFHHQGTTFPQIQYGMLGGSHFLLLDPRQTFLKILACLCPERKGPRNLE